MGWKKDNGNGRYAKTAGDFAQAQGDFAKVQGETAQGVAEQNATKFRPPVDTVALRDSTYPNPQNGDTVRVLSTATMYRFQTGTGWVVTDKYEPTAIDAVNQQLADKVEKGEATLNDFTEADRAVIQGLEPGTINAVLGLKNVKPENTNFLESLTVNLIDHMKLTPGYVDGTTGAIVASTSFKVNDFVEVIPGESYSTNGGGAGGGYYNVSKEFVQAIPWNAVKPLVVPTGLGIRFIRIPFSTSQQATARMFKGTTLLDYTPYTSNFKLGADVKLPSENILGKIDIDVEAADVSFLKATKNIFDKLRIEKGFSVSATTGALNVQTDQNYAVVQFMEVKPSTLYQKSGNYHVAFYDANKTFISGIASGASARSWTTPSNAKYVSITIYITQDDTETYMIYEGSAMPKTYVPPFELTYDTGKKVPLNGKKMVSYGDSLTQMNVWQETVAEKLNLVSVVRGIGSTTVTETGSIAWIDANGSYLDRPPATRPAGSTEILSSLSNDQRIATMPLDAEVIIFMGGTNDQYTNKAIGDKSDPNNVNTFRSAYVLTLKKLLLRCPRARIVTVTPPPNNKHNTANTAGHTGKDYADVIKEESRLLGIPCIDLYGKAGWNEFNMSLYLSDGVHPLDTGGARMAEVIGGEMKTLL